LFHFADELLARTGELGSPCVVGLDPALTRMPAWFRAEVDEADPRACADALATYCGFVLEAVRDLVAAVKPQSAYFERYGSHGARALEQVCTRARELGLLVILDAKRGDIGATSEAYAAAYLNRAPMHPWTADCLTLNPYLGFDSLTPFVEQSAAHGGGVFVCVKTSNPGSADIQDVNVDGVPLYTKVARQVAKWAESTAGASGYGTVGAVVGATFPDAARTLRALMPRSLFLMPGFGAQAGDTSAFVAALDDAGRGALASSSRAIMYPPAQTSSPQELLRVIRATCEEFVRSMRALSGEHR
jgi:orotidine-5'-phosphate decarboxylase